jgi:hypothetical protein
MFKVQCTSCRETHANYVGVNRFVSIPSDSIAEQLSRASFPDTCTAYQETNDMSGSRGEANFVWKCKNCKVF